MSTFITVGNAKQSFNRFFHLVDEVLDLLPQPVLLQTGHNEYQNDKTQVKAFMEMEEFENAVKTSQVLIMHAGAGSIIHAVQMGKRPIVIPRLQKFNEHVDDHQLEFAERLAQNDIVYLCQERADIRVSIEDIMKKGPEACKSQKHMLIAELLNERLNFYAKQLD